MNLDGGSDDRRGDMFCFSGNWRKRSLHMNLSWSSLCSRKERLRVFCGQFVFVLFVAATAASLNQPVLQRLRNVRALDARGTRKIGNRPRHLEHAVVATCCETKLLGGAEQQRSSFYVGAAM